MKLFSILSCIFIFNICSGQNREKLDSLLRIEKTLTNDTNAIKHYLKISGNYKKLNADSAFVYSAKAFRLSVLLQHEKFLPKCRYENYNILKVAALPKILLDTLKVLLEDPIILSSNKYLQTVNFEMGINYRKIGNYERSIKHLQNAVRISKEMNDRERIHNSYNSLANTYSQMGVTKGSQENLRRAISTFDLAFEYLDPTDKVAIGNLINNKGVNYYNMGTCSSDTSYVFKAIQLYKEALKIREEMNDPELLINAYDNLASSYHALSDIGKDTSFLRTSQFYYERSIALDKKTHKELNYSLLANYGSHLSVMGKLLKDRTFTLKGLELLKDAYFKSLIADDLFQSSSISLNIANSYSALGIYDSSTRYYFTHVNLRDLILSAENKQIAEEMAAKFESDLKETENANLKQQAQLREEVISKKSFTIQLMIGASVIMLGLIVIVFISRQKVNRSRELLREKQLETERQKILIENKQKEILDSIKYAKRIQESLMPTEKFIRKILDKKHY